MAFTDFTGVDQNKVWKITDSTVTCRRDEIVTIRGSEKEVRIECDRHSRFYGPGTYSPEADRITSSILGNYSLEIQEGTLVCSFDPKFPGSWTAEDQGPFPG